MARSRMRSSGSESTPIRASMASGPPIVPIPSTARRRVSASVEPSRPASRSTPTMSRSKPPTMGTTSALPWSSTSMSSSCDDGPIFFKSSVAAPRRLGTARTPASRFATAGELHWVRTSLATVRTPPSASWSAATRNPSTASSSMTPRARTASTRTSGNGSSIALPSARTADVSRSRPSAAAAAARTAGTGSCRDWIDASRHAWLLLHPASSSASTRSSWSGEP